VTAQPARHGVGDCDLSSIEEMVVIGKQTVRQAARLAAFEVQQSIGVSELNVTGGSRDWRSSC
jgi:hypothetical protein